MDRGRCFFVLSGFLIGGILIDQRNSPNFFRVFYLRRALRIFPPYIMLLTLWISADTFFRAPGMRWLLAPQLPAWPYWLYLQNFWMATAGSTGPNFVGATWSLAIEEQFYLIFPLIVWWLPSRILPLTLGVGILLAPTMRALLALLGPDWNEAQLRLLPTRWDSLVLGALAAWIIRDAGSRSVLGRHRRRWLRLLALLGGITALIPIALRWVQPAHSPSMAFFMHLIVAMFFALLILLLSLDFLPRLSRLLSNTWLRFFGRISYTLYLFHTAFLGLAFALILHKEPILAETIDWATTAGAFMLAIVFSTASWHLIESRLVDYGHRSRYALTAFVNKKDRL